MTVSTEISSNEYTGNGLTTDFDYKFRIFKAEHLSVTTSDADGDNVVTLRLGTDYTVTGANKSAGGKVILTKPLASGHKISIARDIPIKQETSFRNQSKFLAETHEDAFDYLTMIVQRIWGSLGSLYLKRPNILANWFDAKGYRIANLGKPKRDTDAVDLGTLNDEISGVNSTILKHEKRLLRVDDMDISALPKANERAGNLLAFDGDGKPIAVAPASGSAVDVLNQLGKGDGAKLVAFKPSEVAGAVKLSVYDILHDGLTVKNFGAKGNWNATTQTGSDDTDAFEAYAAYINTLQNPRSGGARVMRVPAGSYRLDGFKITQGEAYWSFNMIGEGQLTQLWFNPNGEGIILGNENSQFSNITLNGKLNPSYPTTQDPAIPYIVRAKLDNKLTDVDLVCNKVDVFWYHCFARIAGRGFTFKNGTAGMGGSGGLCEIACDDDLIIAGDTPSIHSLETLMRHFKVEGSRFDVNSRVFQITGSHPVKEYINGLTISDCELTNCTTLIESTDCRLVSPIFSGNLTIGCFTSSRSSGVINVPRAVNVQDINNSWNNYINPENTADSRDKGISYIHRYTDINGLTIKGTTAKDLVFGVVRATGNCKGVSITGNTLLGFGDLQNNATILEFEQTPEYVDISHNTISSKTAKSRRWLSNNEIQSGTIQISNNNCDSTFPVQGLIFKPTMIGANGSWSTYAEYRLESGYIAMDFICTSSNCTSTTGIVKISVPVQVGPLEINLTDRFSGAGTVGDILGFSFSGGGSVNLVADSSENAIVVKRTTNLKISYLSYSERDSQTVSIKGSIRYKSKK
ncbi:hypothetical protein [Providencia rettgeri]|uniref:hypothetical protein n=1 Tax=Providencia rettgeri TaxID=587 RepID=UPI003090F4A0|nr:hypothetical protein VNI59_10165 [Providencia rettgeri]